MFHLLCSLYRFNKFLLCCILIVSLRNSIVWLEANNPRGSLSIQSSFFIHSDCSFLIVSSHCAFLIVTFLCMLAMWISDFIDLNSINPHFISLYILLQIPPLSFGFLFSFRSIFYFKYHLCLWEISYRLFKFLTHLLNICHSYAQGIYQTLSDTLPYRPTCITLTTSTAPRWCSYPSQPLSGLILGLNNLQSLIPTEHSLALQVSLAAMFFEG